MGSHEKLHRRPEMRRKTAFNRVLRSIAKHSHEKKLHRPAKMKVISLLTCKEMLAERRGTPCIHGTDFQVVHQMEWLRKEDHKLKLERYIYIYTIYIDRSAKCMANPSEQRDGIEGTL